jgi:peptidoglycan glycosyltransferase
VAAWAGKLGLVDPQTTFDNMTRPVTIDGHQLECAGAVETGSNLTLGAALRAGCPSPIVDLGLILGGPALDEIISAFGFDEPSPIQLESPLSTSGATPATTSEIRLSAVGQGSLLVSPLQMARAFGALLNDGFLPAPQLVEAFRRPDGEWESVPTIDVTKRVLESGINRSLVGEMTTRGSDLIRVSAWSLSGPGEERIAWYLVGRLSDTPVRVVVVALEGGTPDEAEQVGLSLLR